MLKDAGFNASDSLTQSIYIGLVKLIMVIVALAMMDRFGRRDLLLVGTLGERAARQRSARTLGARGPPPRSARSPALGVPSPPTHTLAHVLAHAHAGMTISLAMLGTFLTLKSVPLMSAVSLFLYMGFFEISLGPVMWLLLSELYPLSVRGPAMSIGSTACWIFTVTVTFTFP